MVGNVSFVQGHAQPLVIIHQPRISTASLSKGWGGLEGRIGLPASQPVPHLSGPCMDRGGHGCFLCKVYLVYKESCHLMQYTYPIVLPLINVL